VLAASRPPAAATLPPRPSSCVEVNARTRSAQITHKLSAVASQAKQAAWTLARPELHHRLSCWGSDPGPEDTSHAPAMAQLMLEQGVLTHDHITQPIPQHMCTTANSTSELDTHAKSGAQVCHCVHSWRKNERAERCNENEAPTDRNASWDTHESSPLVLWHERQRMI
jgi:hypothetical protein